MTALYEAMTRIEHGVWCRRSEGDLGRATGKQSWDLGNLGEAAIAAERFGVADPDSMPWSESAVLYTAKPHGAEMTAKPMSTTPDRAGRTLRIDAGRHSTIEGKQAPEKKDWLNFVGPMAFMCTLPADFGAAPATGVYSRTTDASGGRHAMLVVGFDDQQSCWIVKNSWGTWFGDRGFARVAFGQSWLEDEAWTGVRNTNPDPWTKRRQRNGVVIESGNGGYHQNRELFVRKGSEIAFNWQEAGSGPMRSAGTVRSADKWRPIPADALDCPSAVQSTFNRNFELIYRASGGALRHVYFDQASQWWFDAHPCGPPDPVGMPGFVQGNRGAPGDFEVVVLTASGAVEHWTKHNSSPWTRPPGTWYRRAVVDTGMAAAGPALVMTRRNTTSELEQERGELHYVCSSGTDLHHYRWTPTGGWGQAAAFGAAPYSGPCMIEGLNPTGNELDSGELHLFAETGGAVEHWTLAPPTSVNPTPVWAQAGRFGTAIRRVVGALQGSSQTLVVYVERTDDAYASYAFVEQQWEERPIVL